MGTKLEGLKNHDLKIQYLLCCHPDRPKTWLRAETNKCCPKHAAPRDWNSAAFQAYTRTSVASHFRPDIHRSTSPSAQSRSSNNSGTHRYLAPYLRNGQVPWRRKGEWKWYPWLADDNLNRCWCSNWDFTIVYFPRVQALCKSLLCMLATSWGLFGISRNSTNLRMYNMYGDQCQRILKACDDLFSRKFLPRFCLVYVPRRLPWMAVATCSGLGSCTCLDLWCNCLVIVSVPPQRSPVWRIH